MTIMRTIAKAGGWEVVLDVNGVVSIRQGYGMWVCDYHSAYDAIRYEVHDPAIRAELLKQWNDDKRAIDNAEEATPLVEDALGKRAVAKDLVEELKEGAI